MTIPKLKPQYTVDQYLKVERAAEERHIYVDGEIYLMAGENLQHGYITLNLAGLFYNQLRGKPCRASTKDTKVRSGPVPMSGHGTKGMFSYPDIVVVCGEPECHDAHKDIVLNPKVIVEALSPSTETFDRGEKWTRYQTWNPTLTDYLLVSQTRPQVEHYVRQADGTWSYSLHEGLEAKVDIASIGCTLRLADVFEGVTFAE